MSKLLDMGRLGEPLTDYDVVDIHAHLGSPPYGSADTSVEMLVRVMDRVGVQTSVASFAGCLHAGSTWGNDRVHEATQKFPGRINGYARFWPSSEAEVREEAERCLSADGFVGVKLHNANGFDYAESAYLPALELANDRHMLVLFHTWGAAKEFEDIRDIATRHPDLSLLLGHSGCLEKEEYVKIAQDMENIYLELCFSRAPYGMVEYLVGEAGADKVLWGSDAVYLSTTQQIGKVLGALIPDEDKIKVLSGNARRLLGKVKG